MILIDDQNAADWIMWASLHHYLADKDQGPLVFASEFREEPSKYSLKAGEKLFLMRGHGAPGRWGGIYALGNEEHWGVNNYVAALGRNLTQIEIIDAAMCQSAIKAEIDIGGTTQKVSVQDGIMAGLKTAGVEHSVEVIGYTGNRVTSPSGELVVVNIGRVAIAGFKQTELMKKYSLNIPAGKELNPVSEYIKAELERINNSSVGDKERQEQLAVLAKNIANNEKVTGFYKEFIEFLKSKDCLLEESASKNITRYNPESTLTQEKSDKIISTAKNLSASSSTPPALPLSSALGKRKSEHIDDKDELSEEDDLEPPSP